MEEKETIKHDETGEKVYLKKTKEMLEWCEKQLDSNVNVDETY